MKFNTKNTELEFKRFADKVIHRAKFYLKRRKDMRSFRMRIPDWVHFGIDIVGEEISQRVGKAQVVSGRGGEGGVEEAREAFAESHEDREVGHRIGARVAGDGDRHGAGVVGG